MATITLDKISSAGLKPSPTKKGRTVALGDAISMQGEEVPQSAFDAVGFAKITPEQVKEWKDQGPIGYVEQLHRQDKTEMLPLGYFGYWGVSESMTKAVDLLNAVNNLKADINGVKVYKGREGQKSQDLNLINNYLFRVAEEQTRGYSVGGNIARGQANLPGFFIDFLVTEGGAALGNAAVKAAIKPAMRSIAQSVAKKFATRVTAGLANAVVRTALIPQRFLTTAAERQVAANLTFTKEGLKIAEKATETPFKSFAIAITDQVIENFSEITGPALSKGIIKPVMRTSGTIVPKKMANAIVKAFKYLHPNEPIARILTKAGYHGFIEEMGEERVGALLRATFGIEDFGAEDPKNPFDRIIASLPNAEELLIEAGVLAPMSAGSVALTAAIDSVQREKMKAGIMDLLKQATDEQAKVPDSLVRRALEEKQLKIAAEEVGGEEKIEVPQFKSKEEAVKFGRQGKAGTVVALENAIKDAQRIIDEAKDTEATPGAKEQKAFLEAALRAASESAVFRAEQIKPTGDFNDFLDQRIKLSLSLMKEKADKREINQIALDSIDEIVSYLKYKGKGRINRSKSPGIEEELAGIPREFLTKEGGYGADVIMDELNNAGLGVQFENESQMVEFLQTLVKQRENLRAEIKSLTPKIISRRETTILAQRVRDIERGGKRGKRIAFKEVKAVQDAIIKEINSSALDPKQKAQFLKTIKGIQKIEQFVKRATLIRRRIDRMEEANRKRDLIQGFRESTSKRDIKKVRPEFQKQLQSIVDQLDPSKLTEAKIEDLNSLAKYLENNPENNVPQSRIDELKRLDQVSLRDMTSDEVEVIVNAIQHVLKLSELKGKLLVRGKIKEHKAIAEEAVKNIIGDNVDELEGSINLNPLVKESQTSDVVKFFTTSHYNAELKAEIIEGREDGVFKIVIYEGIDKGVDKQFQIQFQFQDFMQERLKGINLSGWSVAFEKRKEDIKVDQIKIGPSRTDRAQKPRTIGLTPGQKIAFYLHSLNKDGRRHLLKGGFSHPGTPDEIIDLSAEDIEIIVDSLTPQELKVANVIYEYLNDIQKPELNRVSVELDGYEVATVNNYFPIRTTGQDKSIGDILGKSENKRRFQQVLIEQMGMLKERTGASGPIVLEDAFVASYKNMLQASAYIGLAGPIRSARALLDDPMVKKAIVNTEVGKGLKDMYDSLQRYLDIVEGDNAYVEDVERMTQELINKLDVSILGLNPWVMAKQPISYYLAGTEMDIKLLMKNFRIRMTKAEYAEMMKWAPQLRNRYQGNITQELGEVARVGRVLNAFTGKELIDKKIMAGIEFFDMSATGSIWRTAKEELKKKNPNLDPKSDEFMQKVADRTWEVVRKTQPTFHRKDRSDIANSKQLWVRLMTKYSSQQNKNYMMMRRAILRYNNSEKTNKDKAKLAATLVNISFVSSALIVFINTARSAYYDRKESVNLFESMVLQFIENAFGNVYFVGPMVQAIGSKLRQKSFIGFGINDPVTDVFNDAAMGAYQLILGISDLITKEEYKTGRRAGEEKWKTEISRGVAMAIDTAGRVRGLPIESIRRLLAATGKRAFGIKEEEGPRLKVPKLSGKGLEIPTLE